ncbi:transcriptional adapter 1-like isoform X2 [Dermacentor andersoni]|uniref:transcriptional adapter 1-like isoform X2 n=1 Tax=Dermacentor andersoni TaxID=34620 RepID=UPI003B3B88C0
MANFWLLLGLWQCHSAPSSNTGQNGGGPGRTSMAACTNQLVAAKQKLSYVLGDRFKTYMNCLKLWFSQKLTKEDFDSEVRKVLSQEGVHAHNEFLLAFFNKCQAPCAGRESSSSSHVRDKLKKLKSKVKPVRVTFEKRFVPVAVTRHVPTAREPAAERSLDLCLRERCLPDSTLVHGRMFVIAWDCGLEAVDDRAVELVLLAIKQRLRALLSAVLSRRSAYKLRDGRMLHTLGCAPPNPYLRFAARCHFSHGYSRTTAVTLAGEHQPCAPLSLDWAESRAALEVAADPSEHPPRQPVCAADLLETLQVRRDILLAHSVQARALEHTLAAQWHPSHEELRQASIHEQEEALRTQLLEHHQLCVW